MKALDASHAAKTLCENMWALNILHTYFDDARQRGLPPHHAINAALGKLAKLEQVGAENEDAERAGNRGKVRP